MFALFLGIGIGLLTEILRKAIKTNGGYKNSIKQTKSGYYTDLALDCVFLPSPYASSFGGFVEFGTSAWFGIGGIFSSLFQDVVAEQEAGEGRARRAAGGHEHDVARRRRAHCGRFAGGAGIGDLGVVRYRHSGDQVGGRRSLFLDAPRRHVGLLSVTAYNPRG